MKSINRCTTFCDFFRCCEQTPQGKFEFAGDIEFNDKSV